METGYIRRKVIAFKQDGNNIKQCYMDLLPQMPHVYIANRTVNGSFIDVDIVLEVKGVLFKLCCIDEARTQKESILMQMEQYALSYLDMVMANEAMYHNRVILELFRQVGTKEQLQVLQKRREKILEDRQAEEDLRIQKEQQKEEENKRLHEQDYQKAVQNFIEGKFISPMFAAEMLHRNKIKIHPKTIHNLQTHCTEVKSDRLKVSDKKRSYDGVFLALKQLDQKLKDELLKD